MSLLFDIFQLDQLSQIKELSLEGNSTLNDILDLQQSMYEDEQLQKSLKNLAYNYRKLFNSIKTSSRTFSDFYYLYKFIEELSDLDITSDDFNDIKDKEYFDELINDAKIYSSTFITDIGVERFEGYKQGIGAIKECLFLDKIIDNEDKYSAYKALEIEENKKLKESVEYLKEDKQKLYKLALGSSDSVALVNNVHKATYFIAKVVEDVATPEEDKLQVLEHYLQEMLETDPNSILDSIEILKNSYAEDVPEVLSKFENYVRTSS